MRTSRILSMVAVLGISASCALNPTPTSASENSYAESVLADKPVGFWRFEEGTGSQTAIDTVDEKGAANGSYYMVTLGKPSASNALGTAAEFHGAGACSYVDLGSPKKLMIRGDMTIEWWQYVANDDPEDQAIICWAGPGEGASENVLYEMVLRYSDQQKQSKYPRPQFVLGHEYGQGTNVRMTSELRSQFNRWYHVAAVRDAEARTVQFYINGLPSGDPISYSVNDSNPQGGESVGAAIGRLGQFDNRYFQGMLDEVAVYDHVLAGERILAHYRIALEGISMAQPPLIVAHRGNNRFAPENTLISYKQAIEAGAPIVELDLQYSGDGVIILMHDKTLDRTTSGAGEVNSKSYAELKKLDAGIWKDSKYAGEPVPSFTEVAKVCKDKTVMMLDLKTLIKGSEIAAVLSDTGFPEDQLIVAPWVIDHAPEIKPYLPDASMILLHSQLPSEYNGDDAFFDQMKHLGFSGFSLNWQHLTEPFVRGAQRHGMKVYTWTINDQTEISGAVLLNVDGIITDDPKASAEYIQILLD